MRSVFVLCASLLTACSTQAVRCERHLTPVNVLERPIAGARAPGEPGKTKAEIRSATQSGGTPRATAHAESVAPKQPAPGPEGSP